MSESLRAMARSKAVSAAKPGAPVPRRHILAPAAASIRTSHGMVNPLLDIQKALPATVDSENYGNYDDSQEVELYERMLRETDPRRQRVQMRKFEKYVLDDQAHMIWILWWHRIVPYRSYVEGFKISPTHFINQDLATIWLDK